MTALGPPRAATTAAALGPGATTTSGPTVADNARVMVAGTALSRLTGYGRVLALGYALGFNRLGDAYNLANVTPNIIYDLVLGGVLSATLVPVFVSAVRRARGEEDWDAVSAVFTVTAVVLAGLSVVFFLAVPALVHLYTLGTHQAQTAAERRLAVDLLYLFVPQLALYGLVALMTALLNARRRFANPAFTPILNNLVVIAVLLSVPHVAGHRHPTVDQVLRDHTARLVLGWGTTAGVAVMTLAMIPAVLAAAPGLRWRWRPGHPAVRTLIRLAGWTAGVVAANQIALFIVTVLALGGAGDLSAYQAAYMFFLLPHGVFTVSVLSAIEPEMAECWTRRDVAAYRRHLADGIKLVAAIVVPAGLGYAVLGRPVVRLLLQHGSLSAQSARTTADVLAIMALGLPAFSLYLLLMRAYQAMQDTRSMFISYVVENIVNIVLAFALYPLWGVRGLAAALALAYAAGGLFALADISQRVGGLHDGRVGIMLYRITVAAAITADLALAVSVIMAHLFGTSPGLPLLLRVAVAVIAGVTFYLRVARYFGVQEVRSLLQLRRRAAT